MTTEKRQAINRIENDLTSDTTGVPVSKRDIPQIKRLLNDIEQRYGIIKPQAVVDAARSPDSPIHQYFTWDDREAADQHRLWQARKLIACVTVTYKGGGPVNRGYVNLKIQTATGPERGYVGIVRALSDEDMRAQFLERARLEAREWRRRYQDLNELASVFAAIDNL